MREAKCDAVVVDAVGGATADKIAFSDIYGGIVECWAYGSIRYTVNDKLAVLPADVARAAKIQIRRLNDAREKYMGLPRLDRSEFRGRQFRTESPVPPAGIPKDAVRAMRTHLDSIRSA